MRATTAQDGSCLGLPYHHRFLEQIYVPPGRDAWTPSQMNAEQENLLVEASGVPRPCVSHVTRPEPIQWHAKPWKIDYKLNDDSIK